MTATELLNEIYAKRVVVDAAGREHPLHSEITADEGELLVRVVRDNGLQRTLEIGCAYGLSSLYICAALAERPGASHTIIDPFQNSEWFGIGVENLRRAGCTFFELIEQPSEFALPDLVRRGEKYQFALIDGFHTFDQTLVDFYFVNRLLDPGGVVILDDVHLPAVHRVARWVSKLSNYRVVDTAKRSKFPPSWRRRAMEKVLRAST